MTAYSLDLGKEHTDLLDAKLQRKMMTPGPAGKISASDVDLLAVIAMAGVAAEGMSYEQVTGQNADLFLLQKILNKSQDKLPAAQQQTITRWAVRHTRDMREKESSMRRERGNECACVTRRRCGRRRTSSKRTTRRTRHSWRG